MTKRSTPRRSRAKILNRASVPSAIRRQFGLSGDPHRVTPAEAGVAEMLVALYHTFDSPLDHATLWAWHRMLMRGRPALAVSGGYRQHAEAMQVVSGSVPTRIVTDQRYSMSRACWPVERVRCPRLSCLN